MFIKSRRRAREISLRILYELEIGKMGPAMVLQTNLAEANLTPELQEFARGVISGIWEQDEHLRSIIDSNLIDWDYERLAVIDKNILRIATYELLFMPNIPPAVTINEAIEIAKKYSTVESGRFINGVLGNILKASPKADWVPPIVVEVEEEPEEVVEEVPAIEEVDVSDEEALKLARVGGWKLRSQEEVTE